MPGHNATITIKSATQIDSITLSDEYVDLLYPGNPQQTVAAIRDDLESHFKDEARQAVGTIIVSWLTNNVQVST